MPKIGIHAPGSFCWLELATTDQNSAKQFYSSVFGWTPADFPMGPDEYYTMFKLNGGDAGAAYTMRPEERAHVPPHWNLYVSVANADDTTRRAVELGGKIVAPAFDVMTFGRMAVLQDPAGAHFCVWQPKQHIGTSIGGEDGTLCWADLSTPDPARAKTFYEALFNWKLTASERDKSGYLHIQNGQEYIGGVPPAEYRDAKLPAHWLLYFQVADVDATAAKAEGLGAKEHLAPMSMEGVGRFAVLADPQGAAFAIFKGNG